MESWEDKILFRNIPEENNHKEEEKGRIKSVLEDRKELRATLKNCIYLMKAEN